MTSSRPRIGLNLLFVRPGVIGGGETYARGLINGLVRVSSECEFLVFLNRLAWPTFASVDGVPGFRRVLCDVPLGPVLRHLWEQVMFPHLCRHYSLDLLHSLGNAIPLFAPCARVVTIHDLAHRHSRNIPWIRRLFMNTVLPASARRSMAVITVSDHSRKDLVELFRVSPEKLFVTPEGPGQDWGAAVELGALRSKYRLPDEYFLAVGAASHKRLDISIDAVRKLQKRGRNVLLIVVGTEHEADRPGIAADPAHVRFLGHVYIDELQALYRGAIALVCSSEIEGFGLPVLEAMAAGTPVIATDSGALAEVVGEGGLLVKCGDSAALAEMMWKLLDNPTLRQDLRERGQEQVQRYSWEKCALATFEIYKKVLSHLRDVRNSAT